MASNHISFKDTGYFSALICDYLEQKETLHSFYNRFPSIENLKKQIEEKSHSFLIKNRRIVADTLAEQYQHIPPSEATTKNIEALKNNNTFTVTTGHQLNLFTGPLYFLYKIISTINFTEEAKLAYPEYHFVPIYWMATEDHDFLEINHFQLHQKKIAWNYPKGLNNSNGFVGNYNTQSLSEVYEVLEHELGIGNNATYLKELFKKGYLEHTSLADATRYIVNELFQEYGLVIMDGNHKNLKKLFIPYIEQELSTLDTYNKVTKTTSQLNKLGVKAQVTPRKINLFYGIEGIRERIEKNEDATYSVVNTTIKWRSYDALKKEVYDFPERFSPNVILRPVYQEVILPNLCYIGGGGELAYWFQLKAAFTNLNVSFPMLLLRNSALLISKPQQKKIQKLALTPEALFMKPASLINYKVRQISTIDIDFSPQKKHLAEQFIALKEMAQKTDITFLNAVNAQEKKQLKGLQKLENRLLKAQRLKLSDQVSRLTQIQSQLFPLQSLQERKLNFAEFYLAYGTDLISTLKKELKPFSGKFNIIEFN